MNIEKKEFYIKVLENDKNRDLAENEKNGAV